MAAHRVGADKVGAGTPRAAAASPPPQAGIAKGARRVLFDSSFIIAILQRPTPWYDDIVQGIGGFEPVVIGPVYEELERLSKGRRAISRSAALAIDLVERGVLRTDGTATGGSIHHRACEEGTGRRPLSSTRRRRTTDDELVSRALDERALVATIDAVLIRQLRASGVPVVSLRRGRVEFR